MVRAAATQDEEEADIEEDAVTVINFVYKSSFGRSADLQCSPSAVSLYLCSKQSLQALQCTCR